MKKEYFIYPNDKEREELRRLCTERDKRLRASGVVLKTIVTTKEMDHRKRLGMNCSEHITLDDFRKKVALENPGFILNKRTLKQELQDAEFVRSMNQEVLDDSGNIL